MDLLVLLSKILEKNKKHPEDPSVLEDYFDVLRALEKTDSIKAHFLSEELRQNIAVGIKLNNNNSAIAGRWYELYRKTLLFDALVNFDAYMQYLEWEREPASKFYVPRRKVLQGTVQDMQDLMDDKLDLLSISMPPGVGKSTLGIFLLSWVMGKFPDGPNLASAHADTLTRSFYDGVNQVLIDPEYLWRDVFPGVIVAETNAKDESIDLVKHHRFSTLTCRAIRAALTGVTRCEKLLYVDDLCSGTEEALSKDRMDALWIKYNNDLKSRRKLGAKELHIATRWSLYDVIGRLQRQYENDPRAKFVTIDALDENNESNFDYPFGVGFDTAYFLDMMASLDEASFLALYMNQPIEREGLLYNVDELQRYYELPTDEPDAVMGLADTADNGSDYTCLPVAYKYGDKFYIEDVVYDNGPPTVTDPLCVDILLRNCVKQCRFESNSAGGRTADKVKEGLVARKGITHITKKFTTTNKETRIIVNSSYVKEHFLFRDQSLYKPNSPYGKFIRDLSSYVMAGKNKHDDAPDSMALLVEFILSTLGNSVEVMPRPW